MQQIEGIKFPDTPGFKINEATDVLLKKHFDKYRAEASIPPISRNLWFVPPPAAPARKL